MAFASRAPKRLPPKTRAKAGANPPAKVTAATPAAQAQPTPAAAPPQGLPPQGAQGEPKMQQASLQAVPQAPAKAIGSATPTPIPAHPAGPVAPEPAAASNPGSDVKTDGKKTTADYTEIGSTGLLQWGGYVYEEFLRALQGDKGIKTYREMQDNDPVIGSVLFAVDMLARQVDWHLDPAFVPPPEPPPANTPPATPIVGPGSQIPVEQHRSDAAAAAQQQQFGHEQDSAAAAAAQSRGLAATQQTHEQTMATQSQITQLGLAASQSGGPGSRDNKPAVRKSFNARYLANEGAAYADSKHVHKIHEMIRKALGEPAVGDDEQVHQAEEAAAFIESCFLDMSNSWEDTLGAILSFVPYGWSYHELIYKKRVGPDEEDGSRRSKFDDGKIGWRKIILRSQDSRLRWEFDDTDGVKGLWQLAPGHPMVFLPIQKCLLFRTTTAKGNPEGRSALRNSFRPWFFKKRIEEFEAIGVERDLAGLPVAGIPFEFLTENATPSQKQVAETFKQIVRNIKRDEQDGFVKPVAYDENGNDMFTFELLSTGGQRQLDTDKIVARYDQRIAMTMLADFIMLGHEKVGSHALGASKIDLFTAALEAWLFHIADVFNTHAIPRLLKLNGIDLKYAPKLTFSEIQPVDLDILGKYITSVAGAGMALFPDADLDAHLREIAGWPAKTEPSVDDIANQEM